MKDNPIYIHRRTEILYQMINDDPNLYLYFLFYMKNRRIVVKQFHIEERIEYSLIKSFTP